MLNVFFNSKYVNFDTVSGAVYTLEDPDALSDMNMRLALALNADFTDENSTIFSQFKEFYSNHGRQDLSICDLSELGRLLNDNYLFDGTLLSLAFERDFADTVTAQTYLNLNFTFDNRIYLMSIALLPIVQFLQAAQSDSTMYAVNLLTSNMESAWSNYIDICSAPTRE